VNRISFIILIGTSCLSVGKVVYAADGTKEAIIARILRADDDAILEAGKSGDGTFIPALEKLAGDRPTDRRVIHAQMALAKLGVKKHLDETITELTTTNSALFKAHISGYCRAYGSEDWRVACAKEETQKTAFEKLAYIRNASTVKVVAQFLYSTEHYQFSNDVPAYWASSYAIPTLRQMVDNPPQTPVEYTREQDIHAWQQWWEQNKDKYP
jgi:hypothetical protein